LKDLLAQVFRIGLNRLSCTNGAPGSITPQLALGE
jgi:hypothetical protein